MNKTRQQELTRWLKQQSIISRRWLMISRLLGVASGLLIVAQAWFLARILHRMVMENIPATALLLPLTLLVLIFVLRAWVVWLRERVGFQAGQHIRYEIRRQVLTASSRQARRGSRANRPAAGQRLFLSKSTTCTTIMPATCPR
ncbi:transport ATP-binding protein CydD [Klebsiella pneumoniae]|uniref:Transport ATP-binding protein CydD n=1 Tax=Klebsiella pneumoniae TaxID=573 RepID=A0A378AG50_KLEPN|nr:transport ATP-binding protein CydD [Klebsiella pneumoniae]